MIRQTELEVLDVTIRGLAEARAALLGRSRTESVESGRLTLSTLLIDCQRDESRAFWEELGAALGVAHAAIRQRDRLACESGDWLTSLKLFWERIGIDIYCTRIIFGRLFSGGASIAQLRQRR